MKTFVSFVFLAVLSATQAIYVPHFDVPLDDLWELYKKSFEKVYQTKEFEITRRLIWETNYNLINRHNFQNDMGYHSYRLGINEYSDMTNDEFNKVLNGLRLKHHQKYNASVEFVDEDISGLPKEVDWRKEGYVTEVKNQGHCGSCWAFSATGSLEGQHFRKTGKLVSLSEQDVIDCSNSCGGDGCEGGLIDLVFKCIKKQGGIDSEKNYPYEAKDNKCRFNRKKSVTSVSSYVDIKKFSEKALQKAVATIGPISVAIDASDFAFAQYKEGVYDSLYCSSRNLDHGVLVVGYGTSYGKDYWLVKNSWGPRWGLKGYIKMARNKNNMCGIATLASYPIV